VKLVCGLALVLAAHAQTADAPVARADASAELPAKAVKLIELAGTRERMLAPSLARFKIDDFVNVAVLAYEKRCNAGELSELAPKTDKL